MNRIAASVISGGQGRKQRSHALLDKRHSEQHRQSSSAVSRSMRPCESLEHDHTSHKPPGRVSSAWT